MNNGDNREKMILENQKLIHYVVQRYGVSPASQEYEDIVEIGTIGLIRAVDTFVESKGVKFVTYAVKCIKNEILLNNRKLKAHENDMWLDAPIAGDDEGKEVTLQDRIGDNKADFIKKMENEEIFIQVFSIILNCMNKKERSVMLHRMGKVYQRDIAKKFNISRTYIAKIEADAMKKIKEFINKKEEYTKTFKVEKRKNIYRITFKLKDLEKTEKNTLEFFKNIRVNKNLFRFKLDYATKNAMFEISTDPEAFIIIAEIIDELENIGVLNKNIVK